MRQRDQRGDVGADHRLPLAEPGVLRRGRAQREARIVDEQVDGSKRQRQCFERIIAGIFIGHVKGGGVEMVGPDFPL
jgi:hypothetical protein